MSRRLPPLNAIRAFEAAARHLSFIKAGEELHVTPGAISQQVKALEDWLGLPLFRRLPRGLLLTDAGQGYWPALRDVFDELEEVTQRTILRDATNVLSVSTLPSFAARWLIPRLGRLRQRCPQLDVRVLASTDIVDFVRDNVDVAIRFGPGTWPGLSADLLMGEEVFPVCSPTLLTGEHPLSTLADLNHHTLLHDMPDLAGVHELTWESWLTSIGATGVDASRGPRFTYTHMSIQAAILGQGVALATSVLIGDDLAAGRLVRPLPQSVPAPYQYWIVCPSAAADRPKISAFRDWALGEARGPAEAAKISGPGAAAP